METRELKDWREFEKELERLFELHEEMKKRIGQNGHVSELLFRGQSDSEWSLNTTLERKSPSPIEILDYYSVIASVKFEIEAFTGRSWNIPSSTQFSALLAEHFGLGGFYMPDVHEYMAYLRHHGFPSPLLDWTSSPYIAAFFAFREAYSEKAAHISIYAFIEYPSGRKIGDIYKPLIFSLGSDIKVHQRHFLQKSKYTICCRETKKKDFFFASHEDVFARDGKGQDLLWKFNIPVPERRKVLKLLERSNINSYSLFASEESLMETIGIRKFVLKE